MRPGSERPRRRPPGITLDAGVLIAYDRGDPYARPLLRRAGRDRRPLTIPAPALAQAWRSAHQHHLRDLVERSTVEPLDDELARRAGELMGRTGTTDVADAAVAVSAAQRGDVVMTSDPDDLQRLADDLKTIRVVSL